MRRSLLSGICVFLFGCQIVHHRQVDEVLARDSSLVFGYLDMHDGPRVDFVRIKRIDPPEALEYRVSRGDHGFFYLENLPPGSYRLVAIGGNVQHDFGPFFCPARVSCWGDCDWGPYHLALPEFGDGPGLFEIKEQGVYFIGRWHFRWVRRTRDVDLFALDPTSKPDERDLLKRLLRWTTGTRWEPMVRARLGGTGS